MDHFADAAWWLRGADGRVVLGPYATQDAADAGNPLDEQRLEVYEAVFGLRLPNGTIEEQVSPEMHAARERYATYVSSQLRAAISPAVLDATAHDPYAALLVDVATTLLHAGLALATPDGPVTPDGATAAGLGLEIADEGPGRERVVMIVWSSGESAHAETGRIMMPAIADVLRAHGFTVEPHWSHSGTQVITGRQLLPERAARFSAAMPGMR